METQLLTVFMQWNSLSRTLLQLHQQEKKRSLFTDICITYIFFVRLDIILSYFVLITTKVSKECVRRSTIYNK